jgi:DNA-binding beta-propeller fold protein YncE
MAGSRTKTRRGFLLLVGIVTLLPVLGWTRDLSWELTEEFGDKGRGRRELRQPVDVALTPERYLAVLDAERESVVLFDRSGKWLRNLGGRRGQGSLELKRPSALVVDADGVFWAVDSGNHRLVMFDADGDVLATVGGLGSGEGRFHGPSDMTIGRFGKIYVADSRNQRIQVLRADGSFLASWERRTGGRREHLEVPQAVAFTDQGRGGIWVANRGWSRLERFDLEGEWEADWNDSTWKGSGKRAWSFRNSSRES